MSEPNRVLSDDLPANAAQIVDAQRLAVIQACEPGRTGLSVLQAGRAALAFASRIGDKSADVPQRACRAGCSACCHLAVAVLPIEALVIAAGLRNSRSVQENAMLLDRVRATSARVSHLTIEQRACAKIPCALLGDDGACTIHDFRPIGCRGWTSFDRAACDAALQEERPGHTGPQDHWNYVAAGCVTEGLQHALRELNLPAEHVEFHTAVAVAMEQPDVAERFAAGENPFAGCPRVTSGALRGPD